MPEQYDEPIARHLGGFHLPVQDRVGPVDFDREPGTPAEIDARDHAIQSEIKNIWNVAVRYWGEKKARAAFTTLLKRPAERPRGMRMSDADAALLICWEVRAPGLRGRELARLPRQIATEFKARIPQWYPATVESVEKQLRRLIHQHGRHAR